MNIELAASYANKDQERLLKIVLPYVDSSSAALRQHLQASLTKNKFSTQAFLSSELLTPLSNVMIAGYLQGTKRAELYRKASQQEIKASLELSILSTASDFLIKLKSNFKELRKKYKSLAFGVIRDASKDINKELYDTVNELVRSGSHIREAKEVLQEKFDKLGIRPANKGTLETIFRTQLQIAFAAGKYKAETENPYIYRELWGYRYITTEDNRVRPMHAILDGVTLPKDHPFWKSFYPPNGFNCRCQAIPIFHEMSIVEPPKTYNGDPVKPDKGFAWQAGHIFNSLAG